MGDKRSGICEGSKVSSFSSSSHFPRALGASSSFMLMSAATCKEA